MHKEYQASMERQEQKRIQDAKDREAKSRRKYEVGNLALSNSPGMMSMASVQTPILV